MKINSSFFPELPDDWNLLSLGEIGSFSKGSGIKRSDLQVKGLPCITYGEIYTKYGSVVENLDSYISEKTSLRSEPIEFGDLLFAGSGETAEEIGKTVAYTGKEKAFAGGDIVILRPARGNPEYLGHILNHDLANSQKYRFGQGYSVVHIYSSHLGKIIIPFPPLGEQEKIAQILSTWDEAITKTDELITALGQRKKGLMQRLLTGEVRFPGFTSEWRDTTLGEFFYLFSNKNSSNEDLTILSCSTIHGIVPQSMIFDKRIASKDISSYKVVEKGDLIYDPMLLWDASIGFLEVIDKGVISPAYSTFKFRSSSANREYFKYLLKTHYYREHYKYISQGTNVRRRKAPVEAFLKLTVKLPADYREQDKIVNVLLDIDRSIDLVSKKLSTLKKQKNSLMQRLLTGQVRVKVEE